MKPADIVQVKQGEAGITHWLYAKVVTPNADGSALVIVQHPGNVDHGKLVMAAKDELRTHADVMDQIAALQKTRTPKAQLEARSLLSQADMLTPEPEAPAAQS